MEMVLGVEFIVLVLFNSTLIQFGKTNSGSACQFPIAYNTLINIQLTPYNGFAVAPGGAVYYESKTQFCVTTSNNGWPAYWMSLGY